MTYQEFDWREGFFKPGEVNTDRSPRGYGVRAIKRELTFVGAPTEMKDSGFYGTQMGKNVRWFQHLIGLHVDGEIGPRTMKALCQERIRNFEAKSATRIEIPDKLVCRQIDLESAFYPAARNTTEDYGIGQINFPLRARFPTDNALVCPDGDMQYAYRIGVNVRYVAEVLRSNHKSLAPYARPEASPMDIWVAAIAAFNAPAWVPGWMQAGFPESGGGIIHVGDKEYEKYAWLSIYTKAVLSRSC